MLKRILATQDSLAPLVLRLGLGILFFPHGAQKVLGWFGGYGLGATYGAFTGKMGIPAVFAILAIAAEFLGPIGLVTGLLTRIAAFGISMVMLVAIGMVHFQNGFFMNWSGTQKGEGFEYHLLVLTIAVALMITGGGRASLDRRLSKGA